MTVPALAPATDVYAMFAGGIDQAATNRLLGAIAIASQNNVPRMHLVFQSFGGMVGDGVCLYNVFRALPLDLVLYNVGAVQSIGTIAYLGAQRRKVSAHATFMIHRTTGANTPATAARLKATTESLTLDDSRTEAILREHITLTDAQWKNFDHHDVTISAKEAVEIGLAHEIAEFVPPTGTTLYNI